MAIDQNTYALSIQLALESQAAFDTLDDFGQKITDLEEKVSSAAQKAIQSLTQVAAEASLHLSDIGKQLGDIDANTFKIQTNLADASKELKDQFDTGEEHLKNSEKELDIAEEMGELNETLTQKLFKHLTLQEEFLDLTKKVIAAVGQKNLGHAEQNNLLQNDVDLGQQFGGTIDANTGKTKGLNKQSLKLAASWNTIVGLIKAADADTEKFVTTNYRLYGSQMQLLDSARALSMETGVFQEHAIEAYRALADVKTPRDALDKLAKDVGMATRVTGVSVDVWARYTRNLRSAGMTAEQISKNIAMVAAAQRKLGLSTEDVTKLMSSQKLTGAQQAAFFGKEAPEKFQIAGLALEGMRKQMGFSEQASQDLLNAFQLTGVQAEIFWTKMGTSADASLEEKYRALTTGVRTFADEIDSSLVPAIDSGQKLTMEQQQALSILSKQLGMSEEATLMAVRARKELANTEHEYLLTLEQSTEAFKKEMDLQKQQAEANQAFTGALKELNAIWTSFYQRVLAFLANALTPLIQGLVWLLKGIAWVVDKIVEFINWMEQIPVIGQVISFLKWGAGILLALGLAFLVVSGAVSALIATFSGFGNVMARMSAGVQAFANMILAMARAMGQAIVIILTSIGQGLQALGNSIKSVMLPLLALGAALMMVGIGAYFFAMGVKTIAEVGWSAVPAMLGLIIAIGLLGLVLVGLAMLIQGPVAVGMVILAVAILAVGVAAYLMGAGIMLAAQGFAILSTVLTFELVLKLVLLGAAVIALGGMALIALPGILGLGVGMMVIAIAAVILSSAFWMVAAAIKMIGTEALPALGEAMVQAAIKFALAGAMMIVAGISLIAGGLFLALALVVIAPVAVGLLVTGLLLLVGGAALGVGAGLVMLAGAMILIGGVAMLVGGLGLYLGMLMVTAATPLMFVAGIALVIGAGLMQAGALALMTTGMMVMVGGGGIYLGALMLTMGGQLMIQAVGLFAQAAVGLIDVAVRMVLGAMMLMSAGLFMVPAGALLLVGGYAVLAAGLAMMIGMSLLTAASMLMFTVGSQIGIGGMMMLIGAQSLVTAAGLLSRSSGYISTSLNVLMGLMPKLALAAAMMLPVGVILNAASLQLAMGCATLFVAGEALRAGTASLVVGAMILGMAAEMLAQATPSMMTSGWSVFTTAVLLLQAGVALFISGYMITAASGTLLAGGVLMTSAALGLIAGSVYMTSAAASIVGAAFMLRTAGAIMGPTAWSIYIGLMWLEFAVSRFSKTIDRVEKVAAAMSLLAGAFQTLYNTPTRSLRDLASETMGALPGIERLGAGLTTAAKKLDQGVTAFQGPAERLNTILKELTETIVAFGQGLNLTDDVGRLAAMLENYAALLEGASERIETAVATKAVPAMRAAEQAGIEETVRSEAISTVQVIDQTDGEAREAQDASAKLLEKVNDTLSAIDQKLANMQNGGSELTEILAMLQAYLPNMNKSDSGLGSELNSWAR